MDGYGFAMLIAAAGNFGLSAPPAVVVVSCYRGMGVAIGCCWSELFQLDSSGRLRG